MSRGYLIVLHKEEMLVKKLKNLIKYLYLSIVSVYCWKNGLFKMSPENIVGYLIDRLNARRPPKLLPYKNKGTVYWSRLNYWIDLKINN